MNLLSLCRKTQPRKTFYLVSYALLDFEQNHLLMLYLKYVAFFRSEPSHLGCLKKKSTRFGQTLHMSKQMICASIELITHPLIFCIKYKQKVSILDKTAQLADTSSFQNEINTRENHINYSSAHLCCKIVSYFHQSFPM